MKKYRSDVNHPKIIRLLLIIGVFMTSAGVIGQVRRDTFLDPYELIAILFIVFVMYIFLWLTSKLMPITLKPGTIKCYNTQCKYNEIRWDQIVSAYRQDLYGLPYVLIVIQGADLPLTIPLYLNDMEDFKETVIIDAGQNNPLAKFLESKT